MLSTITVLELGEGQAVAYACKLLRDFGARVIKVEGPNGDPLRQSPPKRNNGDSALFLHLNAGKESVALDIATPGGRSVLRKMIRQTDVLFESLPVDHAREVGVTYPGLRHLNPKLVMASITGFGKAGPRAWYKATDLTGVASGGLALTMPTADIEGEQGLPMRPAGQFAHVTAAIDAASWTIAALIGRNFSGKGAYIDVSEQEAVAHKMARHTSQTSVDNQLPYWAMTRTYGGSSRFYPCKGGHVHFFSNRDAFRRNMQSVMGFAEPDATSSSDSQDEMASWDSFEQTVRTWLLERTGNEIVALCQAKGIPSAPVNRPEQIMADPHIQARGSLHEVDGVLLPGSPVRLSALQQANTGPAPRLGEHTDAVLEDWLGYTARTIRSVRSKGGIN